MSFYIKLYTKWKFGVDKYENFFGVGRVVGNRGTFFGLEANKIAGFSESPHDWTSVLKLISESVPSIKFGWNLDKSSGDIGLRAIT